MVIKTSYIAVVTLLTLSACGNNIDQKPIAMQVEEAKVHIKKFSEIYDINVDWIEVRFSKDLESNVLGQCISWSDGRREIELSETAWFSNTDAANEQLIFHELGHCVLDRDHNNDLVVYDTNKSRPASIMHAYSISASIYTKFRHPYVHELHHVTSYDQ